MRMRAYANGQYIMKDFENLSAARSYGCCLTRLGECDKAISLFKKLIALVAATIKNTDKS